MITWSLTAEILSLIIIMMIGLICYNRTGLKNRREKLFEFILLSASVSIALNIVCVIIIENHYPVSHFLNMLLNSAYFLIIVFTCTLTAAYTFDLLLEHVYDKSCRTRAQIGLTIFSALYTLVLSNLWNRLIFWFDQNGNYHRGILNRSGYVVLMAELIMLGMCYQHNRESVEKKVKRIMYMLPLIAVLLTLFQFAYPQLLLNGTLMAFAILIIFANFQNLQSEQDSLTGISNRKSFFDELSIRLKSDQKCLVILISLNKFSSVNKRFGYHKGNEFLYYIAKWLEEYRHGGRAFRFSNMTFALLCPYVNDEESNRLITRIKERFDQPWELGEISHCISAYFGLMNCTEKKLDATQIIETLTMMMEYAKHQDLQVIEYDKEIELMFQKQKWLEELLQTSIEKRRFEVWYQPIINCKTQQFESAEALIRLRDYNGNLISPSDFIPLTEENGMIEEIGWFVWEEVCRFLSAHPDLPLRTVSLNMSMQQFTNPELSEKIADCLKRNHLSADRIKIEITERVISNDLNDIQLQMKGISANGLMFCMDDFGTGYSNFSNVMHLPFEFIKLDRSLLEKLTSDSRDRMVVQSIIELFHNMNLKIVAEGIETESQKKLLHEMGADFIQGFYYARPMPEDEILAFFKQ